MTTLTLSPTDLNLSIVKEAFDHFQKGNIPALLEHCSDDVYWSSYPNPDVPYGKTYYGREGVGNFFLDPLTYITHLIISSG